MDLDDAGCADTRADAETVRLLQEVLSPPLFSVLPRLAIHEKNGVSLAASVTERRWEQ